MQLHYDKMPAVGELHGTSRRHHPRCLGFLPGL